MAPVLARVVGVLFSMVALSGIVNIALFSLVIFGPSSDPIEAKNRAMNVGYLVLWVCLATLASLLTYGFFTRKRWARITTVWLMGAYASLMLTVLVARIFDPSPLEIDLRSAVVSMVLLVALPGTVFAVCLSRGIRMYMKE
jgi:hypothetical protein